MTGFLLATWRFYRHKKELFRQTVQSLELVIDVKAPPCIIRKEGWIYISLRQLSICLQCGRPGFDPWVGKVPWRRKWQSTPVLLPGKSHGQRSLVDYSPWSWEELDMTEQLSTHRTVVFLVFGETSICFPSGYINLHVYWPDTRVPFSVHPHQHLLFVNFLMIVILTGGGWFCDFGFHFSDNMQCWASFQLYIFHGRNIY